jgi:hypothetical protein
MYLKRWCLLLSVVLQLNLSSVGHQICDVLLDDVIFTKQDSYVSHLRCCDSFSSCNNSLCCVQDP